ncbi:hypothetical protein FNV43_RR09712 [Rhamnella rubrinervis]|uniref:Uncharacterized protein n=1 Tax=Rhamnella rubrinervis TaxID=2594499 RepID=A0A8K0MKG4_9ROSA|nr:hypothetical protein FNV43_RR09712 [Rhamnella rubrinervis]
MKHSANLPRASAGWSSAIPASYKLVGISLGQFVEAIGRLAEGSNPRQSIEALGKLAECNPASLQFAEVLDRLVESNSS